MAAHATQRSTSNSVRPASRLSLRPSHIAPVARQNDVQEEEEMVSINGTIAPESMTPPSNHQTKTGLPDRRYKGQRDLDVDPIINPNYKQATQAQDFGDGIPRTKNGAPDRRYLQSRAITKEQAMFDQAKFVLEQGGAKVSVPR